MPATRHSRNLAGRVTRRCGYPLALNLPLIKSPKPRRSVANSPRRDSQPSLAKQTSAAAINDENPTAGLSTEGVGPPDLTTGKPHTKKHQAVAKNQDSHVGECETRRSGRQRTLSKRLQDMDLDFGSRKITLKKAKQDEANKIEGDKEDRSSPTMKRRKLYHDNGSDETEAAGGSGRSAAVGRAILEIPEERKVPSKVISSSTGHKELPYSSTEHHVEPATLPTPNIKKCSVVASEGKEKPETRPEVIGQTGGKEKPETPPEVIGETASGPLESEGDISPTDTVVNIHDSEASKQEVSMKGHEANSSPVVDSGVPQHTVVPRQRDMDSPSPLPAHLSESHSQKPAEVTKARVGLNTESVEKTVVETTTESITHPNDAQEPQAMQAISKEVQDTTQSLSVVAVERMPLRKVIRPVQGVLEEGAPTGQSDTSKSQALSQSNEEFHKQMKKEEKGMGSPSGSISEGVTEDVEEDTTEICHLKDSPEAPSDAQIVVLKDGKHLLRLTAGTNTNSLLSASDAIVTIDKCGSEVAVSVRAHDADKLSVSSPKDSKIPVSANANVQQVAAACGEGDHSSMISRASIDPGKIKFVTINSPPPPLLTSALHKPAAAPTGAPVHVEVLVRGGLGLTAKVGPPTVLSKDGVYICSMCSYKTEKKANWYKHRRTHSSQATQRPFACDKCKHRAKTSSNLKRHQLTHTAVKTYKCGHCELFFRQKIHLERHIRYKHQKKDVQCKYCDYVCANYKPDLKVHMKRKHFLSDSKDRLQYQCKTCGFVAACGRDLKQHQKFHRRGPELKLYCENCSFVTDCESRLKRHLMVHSKEKPFACGLCEYRGSQKEHVLRHMRKKHHVELVNKQQKTAEGMEILVMDMDQGKEPSDPVTQSTTDGAYLPDGSTMAESTEGTDIAAVNNKNTDGHTTGVDRVHAGLVEDGESQNEGDLKTVADHQEQKTVAICPATSTDHEQYSLNGPEPQGEGTPSAETAVAIEMKRPSVDSHLSPIGTKFIMQPSRRKYTPSDYSQKEKVFSCTHCTMKFAKLINLYKHLQVQHKDMQTRGTDEMHCCVWCDYQTNKKKNLLIHMRKHNYKEGEFTPSQQIYSCVVCNYCSNSRKIVYAHMKKKHKVQVFVKADGTASCVIDENLPNRYVPSSSSTSRAEGLSGHQQGVVTTGNTVQPGQGDKYRIKVDDQLETQMVMLELEPGMPPTAVEIAVPPRGEEMDHEAAVAIEGLQALAEQALVANSQRHQLGRQSDKATKEVQQGEPQVTANQDLNEGQAEDQAANKDTTSNIQLSEEQVLQLSSGDFIEINGEMYKVEFTADDSS